MNNLKAFKKVFTYTVLASGIFFTPLKSDALTIEEVNNPRQEYDGWVTDMADILSAETETELNRLITSLEKTNGAEIAVVTIQETSPTETPKSFATKLFNHWGIGKVNQNNGILFLIAHDENRLEIETGIGIENILPDEEVKRIINTKIVPQFKQNNFDRGTLDGTNALIASLDTASSNSQDWHWSIFPLAGLGLAGCTSGIIRYKKRRNKVFLEPGKNISLQRVDSRVIHCASCHKPMQRTQFIDLTQAQLIAKKLGGVSYRGYECPQCNQKNAKSCSIVAYFSPSDRFAECPNCKELTVKVSGEVIEEATKESKGKFLTKKTCHCCDYQTEIIKSVPRITPKFVGNKGYLNNGNPSHHYYNNASNYGGGYGGGGSSGGGFGGGSSGGGGAGGGW